MTIPASIEEYAAAAVEYVARAVGVRLEFDSDTLPALDHYLREVPQGKVEMVELVAVTSGAYFGEVVRRQLGGRWDLAEAASPAEWKVVLPTGLSFHPVGMVATAIQGDDVADFDASLDAPDKMRPYVEQALASIGEIPADEFFTLCSRLDTIWHVHDVLVAAAARLAETAADGAN